MWYQGKKERSTLGCIYCLKVYQERRLYEVD